MATNDDYARQYAKAVDGPLDDEGAFHAAMRNSGKDTLPHLVFADWLDEHAKPTHAQIIRHHITQTGEPPLKLAFSHHAFPIKRDGTSLVFTGGENTLAFPAPPSATGRWVSVEFPAITKGTTSKYVMSNLEEKDQLELLHSLMDEGARSFGWHARQLLSNTPQS